MNPLHHPRLVCVAGLPRAGSTLLCQLLGMHPQIASEGHSSPVLNTLLALRRAISDDPFYLAQLDTNFEAAYEHLKTANIGFLRGWFEAVDKPVVVDKNRAWLHCAEYLGVIAPEAKILVCVRELGQIYASIEAQHQATQLIDFVDHLADYDRFARADQLFAGDKAIGAALRSIKSIGDLPFIVQKRLYFIKYEDLLQNTAQTMEAIFEWLEVDSTGSGFTLDLSALRVRSSESDSHYRFKYTHRQSSFVGEIKRHEVPARIQSHIEDAFSWYYQSIYPKHLSLNR